MTMTIEQIARITHEANRVYRDAIGEQPGPSWEDAPDWQRESVVDGVRGWLDGSIDTPEESHQSWLELKEDNGWVYGRVKDETLKTHPCLLPYADLPPEQKLKDTLFSAIVLACKPALAEGEIEAGFTITTERGELHRELDERFPSIVEMRAAVNAARQTAGDEMCPECAMFGKHSPGCSLAEG